MEKWVVRPATNKMLAALYGVSTGIIAKHISLMGEKAGKKIGNFWTMNQVIAIIDHLGPPPNHDLIYPTSNRK